MNDSEMEHEINNLKERVIISETKISEMRQSEDRLFRFLLVALFALIGLQVWFNYTVYESDKRTLREELRREVEDARRLLEKQNKESMGKHFKDLNDKLVRYVGERTNWVYYEGRAYALGEIADIWLSLGDIERSLSASTDQFDITHQNDLQYKSDALDKISRAFESAIQKQYRLRGEVSFLGKVSQILQTYPASDTSPRVVTLHSRVKAYKDIP
jgi:hypothetical protein